MSQQVEDASAVTFGSSRLLALGHLMSEQWLDALEEARRALDEAHGFLD